MGEWATGRAHTWIAVRQRRLWADGKVGSAAELLELSDAEAMLVDMKLSLATTIRELRQSKRITQEAFAKLIGSSQSRVAKLEAADPSVSIELLIKSLAALGASQGQIGKVVGAIAAPQPKSAGRKSLVRT